MNALAGQHPALPHARARRWLPLAMLAVNLAGIAAIAWCTNDPHHVALGVVPLAMLPAVLA